MKNMNHSNADESAEGKIKHTVSSNTSQYIYLTGFI